MPRTIRVNENVLVRELEGELVILNLDTEQYHALNETGTRLWTLMTEMPDIDAAVAAMLEEYDVEPELLKSDLERLLSALQAAQLIEIVDSQGA